MAELKYKTRGNSDPNGKPRVYFCCHPADFDLYFETISDEVLSKQNCAIWYLESGTDVRDDFFLDLKQMQLFVMPVTTNLLCSQNTALDIEFRFAIENHIPVLPLMQESGLDELFNQKCGELQFLDKNSNDSTAISYDEKLEKFLSSVLIDDNLSEKIRDAFDAYVFLSYRKKDRKYAQELMRLIHKNEFCRDIAIWYDEFLIPGENFNDSIKSALQKSNFFVLAVTPNLINEPNYIMTIEYPMAQKECKPIIPAELVPTDRKQLSEKYRNIPPCTDAHNDIALSEVLLSSIEKMSIKENDASPEHNYLIGLAYLGGVDVEVDYEKAFSLISSAANHGYEPAIRKLMDMYDKGEGVERDYHKEIEWLEKLSEICWTEFEREKTEDVARKYLFIMFEISQIWQKIGNIEKVEQILEDIHCVADTFSLNSLDNLTFVSACKNDLGDICLEKGQLEKAVSFYKSALAIYRKIAEIEDTDELYIEQIRIMFRLAGVQEKKGNFEKAKKICIQAYEMLKLTSPDRKQKKDQLESSIYSLLGRISKRECAYDAAKEWKIKSLSICKRMAEETTSPFDYCNLAGAYSGLSTVCIEKGEYDDAELYLLEAYRIYEKILCKTMTYKMHCRMASLCLKIGDLKKKKRDSSSAKLFYEKGIEFVAPFVEKYMDRHAVTITSTLFDMLSDIYFELCDYDNALDLLSKSLQIRQKNAFDREDGVAQRSLATTYEKIGDVYQALEDTVGSKEAYEHSYEIRCKLYHKNPGSEMLCELANITVRLGVLLSDMNLLNQSYEALCSLSEAHPDVKVFEDRKNFLKRLIEQGGNINKV